MRIVWFILILGVVVVRCNIEISRPSVANDCEFPHHVAIFCYRRMWGSLARAFICGGSLINSNTVLTAAHCVSSGDKCEIQAGTNDISDPSLGITSKVIRTLIHEGHTKVLYGKDDKTILYDVALLFLDRNFTETEHECIRYANIYPVHKVTINTTGFLPGWGKDEYNKIRHNTLSKTRIPVQPIEMCNATYLITDDPYDFIHENTHLCSGDGLHEACSGDSGGGFVRLIRNSKRWEIMALVSFQGMRNPVSKFSHSADAKACGIGYSGMTRISFYLDWIWERTSPPPTNPPENIKPLKIMKELLLVKPICYGISINNIVPQKKNDDNDNDNDDKKKKKNVVCSGHGKCVFLDECVCDKFEKDNNWEYFEEDCSKIRYVKEKEKEEEEEEEEEEGIIIRLRKNNMISVIFVGIIFLVLVLLVFILRIFCGGPEKTEITTYNKF